MTKMGFLLGGDKNVLKVTVVMVAQLCEYTKNHIGHLYVAGGFSSWLHYSSLQVNCLLYELYLNKLLKHCPEPKFSAPRCCPLPAASLGLCAGVQQSWVQSQLVHLTSLTQCPLTRHFPELYRHCYEMRSNRKNSTKGDNTERSLNVFPQIVCAPYLLTMINMCQRLKNKKGKDSKNYSTDKR